MAVKKGYDRNYGKWFLNDVLRAITTYDLIRDGDRVCVALSGGKDSTTLLYILWYLKSYSHTTFDLSALHIRTENYNTGVLRSLCEDLAIPYIEESLVLQHELPGKSICYVCSRLKRGAISDILKGQGIRKIAYGHHADDVAETFFMNIAQNRKLGSFSPKVEFEDNDMVIIRPLVYLDEPLIERIHRHAGLPVLHYRCPYEAENIRKDFRKAIGKLDSLFDMQGFSRLLVDSLENIDDTNVWENVKGR
jgi:tRNA 2-thiocytidine biosynthesis protein TtcA